MVFSFFKKHLAIIWTLLFMASCSNPVSDRNYSYSSYPVNYADNLWPDYTSKRTILKIWAPAAKAVKLNIYEQGHGDNLIESRSLKADKNGTWVITLQGDHLGKYYTFQTQYNGGFLEETPGIYAKAVGVNGRRAMIVDMEKTNPEGWETDIKPNLPSPNDIILYELHVRDLTSHENAGSSYPGKYLGLVESGTKSPDGLSTGIDHMVEMGITHVHLLPVFDYKTVDETKLHTKQFNWGYDPENYNVPEGSYSSDPYEAEVRIKEFKEMVLRMHQRGIRVIMDVVFNHTGKTENSNFNLEFPGYYYRTNKDGSLSDASGCGNETASERYMMRKFIIESCKYWATEYHVDGFRFDLMGIHDIETINTLSAELKAIDSTLFVYGEGWTAASSPLADSLRALKANTIKLTDVAAFSDDIRDGIKGHVFDVKSAGFVSGAENLEETIKFGVVASTDHPQVDFSKTTSKTPWANKPSQTIGYVSCHDNNTLADKLRLSRQNASEEEIKKMHLLSNAIVLTSQSIPFLHAGVELMRTKDREHNSYNKPDEVNQINWNWKKEYYDVFEYYKNLIALRKEHPAFRMEQTDEIVKHLEFLDIQSSGVVAYKLKNNANSDPWKSIIVVYNAQTKPFSLPLSEGVWTIAAKGGVIDQSGIEEVAESFKVPPISMAILYQE